jgi:hypothetical protein
MKTFAFTVFMFLTGMAYADMESASDYHTRHVCRNAKTREQLIQCRLGLEQQELDTYRRLEQQRLDLLRELQQQRFQRRSFTCDRFGRSMHCQED